MRIRHAACNCGQLHLTCEGEPVRISMCHCLECQRRTGGVFSNQAWFQRQQIIAIAGTSTRFVRSSDSGHSVAFRFCPVCGSTVYREAERFANWIAVAVDAFADPTFLAPTDSVFERRRHGWLEMISHVPIEHSNSTAAIIRFLKDPR
jgi:hypothetical protein